MDIEKAKEICKAYINAIDTFGTIDYKCINNLYEPIEVVLSELEKKEAIINLMAKQLVEAHGWFYSEFDNFTEKDWIDYCRKKVTDINVGDIPEQN